jgi:hypothetical protein
MKYLKILALLLVFIALNAPAKAAEQGLAVVELFTTMGCADSPPADRLLETLAAENNPDTLILSCHVTYFDRPEWKDSLSNPACDARHAGYSRAMSLETISAPQMIINGRFDTSGSREAIMRSGIKLAKSMNTVRRLEPKLKNNHIEFTLPSMTLQKPAEVWLFSYANSESVKIDDGQNLGETVNYVRVIRHFKKIMNWTGKPLNSSLPVDEIKGDNYAIIVQFADFGEIVAAGQTHN